MTFSPRHKRILTVTIAGVLFSLLVHFVIKAFFYARIPQFEKQEETLVQKLQQNRVGDIYMEDALSGLAGMEQDLSATLEDLKHRLEFPFPDWVSPPENVNPGQYFREMHSSKRDVLSVTCMENDVALLDGNLGFEMTGEILKAQAVEDLKRLSLVDKLVSLLAASRVAVIVKVRPQEPVLTGAFKETPNPEYEPGTVTPKTIKQPYPSFIKEYPISLELITDIDPLMDFLNNIRQEKQFLLVRDISVNSELDAANRELSERFKPGMVHVVIAAAGMRFLKLEEMQKARSEAQKSAEYQQWRHKPLPRDIEPKGY